MESWNKYQYEGKPPAKIYNLDILYHILSHNEQFAVSYMLALRFLHFDAQIMRYRMSVQRCFRLHQVAQLGSDYGQRGGYIHNDDKVKRVHKNFSLHRQITCQIVVMIIRLI